jgi:hypothetical protein
MSNIKEIDGRFVNLDTIHSIDIKQMQERGKGYVEKYKIGFTFGAFPGDNMYIEIGCEGKIEYKTREEAEERIRQIIKEQNNE